MMNSKLERDTMTAEHHGEMAIGCFDLLHACCTTQTEWAEASGRLASSGMDWAQRIVQITVTPL